MSEIVLSGVIGGTMLGAIGYALSAIAVNRDKKIIDAIRHPLTSAESGEANIDDKVTVLTVGTVFPALIGMIATYALIIAHTPR